MRNRIRLLTLLALAGASTARADATIDLRPDPEAWRRPVFVEATLRLAGDVTPEAAPGAKRAPQPVAARVELAYRQRGVEAPSQRVVRSVDRLRVGDTPTGGAGLLVAEPGVPGATVAAVGDPLTRSELDLVQLPADPLDLDGLLPGEPVRDGGTWGVAPTAVGALLRVTPSEVCQVVAILSDVTATHAKVRFAGPVHGTADGAAVEIDLRGVALFDRATRQLTRVNLAWSEKRALGPATPAVEASAKLNIAVRPAGAIDPIAEADCRRAATASLDERLRVVAGDWRLLADRDWFVVAGDRHATTLRRVVEDRVAAVTTLSPGGRRTLAMGPLQNEVRQALGDELDRITATGQQADAAGGQSVAIDSEGRLDGRPVAWRHRWITTAGASIAATTTLPADDGPADDAPVERLLGTLTPGPAAQTAAAADSLAR